LITTHLSPDFSEAEVFARIASALKHQGYIILSDVFSTEQLQSLFIDIKKTDSESFYEAGIGREQAFKLNQFVRRDRICWLDMRYQPTRFYLEWAEALRQHLNRILFLGLFDYECHYAHFPKGAFYKKHLDAFQGNSIRRLSSVLYLNPAWQPADGGELVLYAEDDITVLETVLPTFGTMVLFLSEEFPHEVLPTRCSRYSLTGWYRINNTTTFNLDPPV
jgi:SM-20-related protein